MPMGHDIHAQMVKKFEPYSFQRQFVQHSNYPRPPQAAVQPNRLRNRAGQGLDFNYWTNMFQDYEKETGIPSDRRRRLNWRLVNA